MGYAPTVNAVVSDYTLGDTDDDQLYYTHIYLDETKRVRNCYQLCIVSIPYVYITYCNLHFIIK